MVTVRSRLSAGGESWPFTEDSVHCESRSAWASSNASPGHEPPKTYTRPPKATAVCPHRPSGRASLSSATGAQLARATSKKAIFMSSLVHLPAITCAYSKDEKIAIFTANSETLKPMKDLIKDECGVDPEESRFVIVGCQDVPGFEAVAAGEKVDVAAVTPGMITKAKAVIEEHPQIRAILMEVRARAPTKTLGSVWDTGLSFVPWYWGPLRTGGRRCRSRPHQR